MQYPGQILKAAGANVAKPGVGMFNFFIDATTGILSAKNSDGDILTFSNSSQPVIKEFPKVTMSSAQILANDVTAVDLVPAPGIGKALILDPFLSAVKLSFNTTAYTFASQMQILAETAGDPQGAVPDTLVTSASDGFQSGLLALGGVLTIIENKKLIVKCTGAATLGDSPITIFPVCRILNV